MTARTRFIALLAGAWVSVTVAWAQADPGAPPPPQVRSANGVDYVNGGAGAEARDAINAMQDGFTLKLVFSDATGAYLVADHVAIQGRVGATLDVDRAGPWLLVKLPPGRYAVTASYQSKTQQQSVDVGTALRTLNWRFAGG